MARRKILSKMENEGQAMNMTPIFKGLRYDDWKQKMISVLKYFDNDTMEVI